MNDHQDTPRGADDDLPDLGTWDETLQDEGETAAQETELPADPGLRATVLEQRLLHGLLSHYYEDPAAGAARVRRVIDALPAQSESVGGGPTNVIPFWRRFAPAVAAATLLIAVGGWFAGWFDDDEEVLRLVAEARSRASDSKNREYTLVVHRVGKDGSEAKTGEHTFVVRPGGVFRVELDGEQVGTRTIGCDGQRAWQVITVDGEEIRKDGPADQVREMFREGLHPEGFFDVGYLNVDRVLSKVPELVHEFDYSLQPGEDGERALEHIEGRAVLDLGTTDLTYLSLYSDPATDEVIELEFTLYDQVEKEAFRFEFVYQGEVEVPDGYYSRPW